MAVKTEHFKVLTNVGHASAVADHAISAGRNIKWDHFEVLASGKSDLQCKIKETLLIRDLKPAPNENFGSEKLCPFFILTGSYFFWLIIHLFSLLPVPRFRFLVFKFEFFSTL